MEEVLREKDEGEMPIAGRENVRLACMAKSRAPRRLRADQPAQRGSKWRENET